jgi:transcriptional regulator with XRE-family HTH domain
MRKNKNCNLEFSRQPARMTNDTFRRIQTALGLSGRELAEKLGVKPPSVSRWREDTEIPDYIANLMQFLEAEATGKMQIPLSLSEMIGLSRAAEHRGLTVEALLLQIIRGVIRQPTSYTAAAAEAAEQPTPKAAEPIIYKGPQSLAKPRTDPH